MQGLMIRVELPAVKNEASYLVDGGENSLQNSTATKPGACSKRRAVQSPL